MQYMENDLIQDIAVIALIFGVAVYWIRVERPKDLKEKKERQMMADYSDIIAKLTVLTGAGLTLPQAWLRLAADYEARKEKTGIRWAYEEVVVTGRQIRNGVSATEAFSEFGHRIGLHAYIKLGNLLKQNMKKGTRGLEEALRSEAYQAFEERKNQVRRTGEEVSTRLLLPMFMMFGVVLVIILIPALTSLSF